MNSCYEPAHLTTAARRPPAHEDGLVEPPPFYRNTNPQNSISPLTTQRRQVQLTPKVAPHSTPKVVSSIPPSALRRLPSTTSHQLLAQPFLFHFSLLSSHLTLPISPPPPIPSPTLIPLIPIIHHNPDDRGFRARRLLRSYAPIPHRLPPPRR